MARRTYTLNENFFDKIDCEEKAYFLGFLYADGWVDKKGYQISISLIKEKKKNFQNLNHL